MEVNVYLIYVGLVVLTLDLFLSLFLLIAFRRYSFVIKKLKGENPNTRAIQKIGVVKFNGFSEMGGKVSFCLALLNEKDEGVVITSLTSRDFSRVYIRDVGAGAGKNHNSDLLSEEKEAVKRAKEYGE